MGKPKWEIEFNRLWRTLSVGQHKTLWIEVYGQAAADRVFRKIPIASRFGDKPTGKFVINDMGTTAMGIRGRRKMFNHFVSKFNIPKLDFGENPNDMSF